MSSSPACVRVRAAVPAGSSRTLTAPRAASASAHGRMRSATRTTRKERSRNNASIEKRMKNIVIEPVVLNDRGDEALQLLYIDALADPPQRFLTGLADALLARGAFELVAQGSLHLLGYLHQSGIEAEAGLDRDREQVERVGELFEDRVAASAGPGAQVEVRRKEPEDQATEKSSERGERVARHEVQERGARDRSEDANKGLHAEEELDARGLHAGALEANLKRPRRVRRVKARHDRGESRDDRLEGPFGDRPLKLELFERSRAHRDLLQAGLHRTELAPHEARSEEHEDP